jgi:hypothetical protein
VPSRLAPHFRSLDEQTALIAEMEGRNPYRQLPVVIRVTSLWLPALNRELADCAERESESP